MKQTAVEWLFEQLWNTPKDKLNWYAILQQAKEIEKEQIVNTFKDAQASHAMGYEIRAEQYYNNLTNK
jgi:hypothetical protein